MDVSNLMEQAFQRNAKDEENCIALEEAKRALLPLPK